MRITKEQNQKDWKELCEYVKTYILKYDSEKLFPKQMALRLKGLACNQEYPNKKFAQIHPYSLILKIFKALKPCIEEVIEKVEIKNEEHLVNLIMKVIWSNFNDILDAYRKTLRRQREMKKRNMVEVLGDKESNKDNYVNKDRKVKDNW